MDEKINKKFKDTFYCYLYLRSNKFIIMKIFMFRIRYTQKFLNKFHFKGKKKINFNLNWKEKRNLLFLIGYII